MKTYWLLGCEDAALGVALWWSADWANRVKKDHRGTFELENEMGARAVLDCCVRRDGVFESVSKWADGSVLILPIGETPPQLDMAEWSPKMRRDFKRHLARVFKDAKAGAAREQVIASLAPAQHAEPRPAAVAAPVVSEWPKWRWDTQRIRMARLDANGSGTIFEGSGGVVDIPADTQDLWSACAEPTPTEISVYLRANGHAKVADEIEKPVADEYEPVGTMPVVWDTVVQVTTFDLDTKKETPCSKRIAMIVSAGDDWRENISGTRGYAQWRVLKRAQKPAGIEALVAAARVFTRRDGAVNVWLPRCKLDDPTPFWDTCRWRQYGDGLGRMDRHPDATELHGPERERWARECLAALPELAKEA